MPQGRDRNGFRACCITGVRLCAAGIERKPRGYAIDSAGRGKKRAALRTLASYRTAVIRWIQHDDRHLLHVRSRRSVRVMEQIDEQYRTQYVWNRKWHLVSVRQYAATQC